MSSEIIRPHHGRAEPDTVSGHKSDELRKWPTNPGSACDAISRRKTESLLPPFDTDQEWGGNPAGLFVLAAGPRLRDSELVKVGLRMTNGLIMASLASVLPGPTPLMFWMSFCFISESHKMRVFLLLPLLVMSHISPTRRWMNHNPSCIRQMIRIYFSNRLRLILQQLRDWALVLSRR